MTGVVSALANLIEAIEDVPGYPFGMDVRKASQYLEDHAPASEDVAALHLRIVLDGVRCVSTFPFRDDVKAAERALMAYRPSLA